MTVVVKLEQFLRTGVFGSITFGMTRQKLRESLGSPDAEGFARRKDRYPSILKYGDIEFYFDSSENDRLYMIFSDIFEIPTGNKHLQIESGWLRRGILRQTVEEKLTAAEIPFKPVDTLDDHTEGLSVGNGVELRFNLGVDDEPRGLISFSRSVQLLPKKPILKQMTLSIPEEAYIKLRSVAQERSLSASQLCREWILAQLESLPDKKSG